MPTALDLRAERARIWQGNKELLDKAESENRALTAEERQEWDRRESEMDDLAARISDLEAAQRREMELAADPNFTGNDDRTNLGDGADTDALHRAFWQYVKRGMKSLDGDDHRMLEQRATEVRAQGTTPDSAGGYLVPEGFVADIQQALKAYGGVREWAQSMPTTSGNNLPWPKMDDTGNKGARVDENTQHAEQNMTFDSVTLRAFTYSSKIVRVSMQLLQDDGTNIEGRLPQWLATRIARITNEEMTLADGNDKPQGIVTAAGAGRTAATPTGLSYPDFVELIHSVDPAYRRNARWMFNDTFLKTAKLLKDNDDRPLWVPGVAVREPDVLAGYSYVINQDMASPGANNVSAVFGDGSYYMVRDVLEFTLLRLEERYADFLQVGFLGFSRHDGRAVFEGDAPFKKLTHPAS